MSSASATDVPRRILTLLIGATLVVGCQPAGRQIPSARVAGAVTLDGEPLNEGGVTFVPTEAGQGPTVWAKIELGRYDAPAVPLGRVLVRIHATRLTGRKINLDGMLVDERVGVVDAKYRLGVELNVEHDLEGQDYALTSKSKSRRSVDE